MRLVWVNYSPSAHGVGAWTSKKAFRTQNLQHSSSNSWKLPISLPFSFPGFLLYGVWSIKTIQHLLFLRFISSGSSATLLFHVCRVIPDLSKQTSSRCRDLASYIGMYLAGPVHKSETPHILKMLPLSLHHNDKRTCEFTMTALLPILSQSFSFSLVSFDTLWPCRFLFSILRLSFNTIYYLFLVP